LPKEELKSFLKITNGVQDIDVRDEGICGFDLVNYITSENKSLQSLRESVRGGFEGPVVTTEMRERQMMRIKDFLVGFMR
jgi:hypothetical protein